jgi:sphingolipid delta-4 desaturase
MNVDPDLPLHWEAKASKNTRWYKYFFYLNIEIFYALRPIFMNKPSVRLDELLNLVFIAFTTFLIYYFWGSSAFWFIVISGGCSIGAHPAAVHIIAEHYEFIRGE